LGWNSKKGRDVVGTSPYEDALARMEALMVRLEAIDEDLNSPPYDYQRRLVWLQRLPETRQAFRELFAEWEFAKACARAYGPPRNAMTPATKRPRNYDAVCLMDPHERRKRGRR